MVCFGFTNIVMSTVRSDRSLIRCAAHSARSSEQGMPQTFSVYVLKKMLKSRWPKRLVTHCSKVSSRRCGKSCQRR